MLEFRKGFLAKREIAIRGKAEGCNEFRWKDLYVRGKYNILYHESLKRATKLPFLG